MRERHGFIQHSFAVRIPRHLRPLYAHEDVPDAHRLLRTIFQTSDFVLGEAEMTHRPGSNEPWDHSLLVRHRQTTIEPRPFPFKDAFSGKEKKLPKAVSWSESGCPPTRPTADPWQGFVIGGVDRPRETPRKDFLVQRTGGPQGGEGAALSRLLCQLLAHRRSRLFGLPLAREMINVLLPHAVLKSLAQNEDEDRGWVVQPTLSLSYVYGSRGFRPIFSFSLFLFPCETYKPDLPARRMSGDEMHDSVRNQWPLATAFDVEDRVRYTVSGPLGSYLAAAAGPAMESLDLRPREESWTAGVGDNFGAGKLTLRMFTEATLFAITLRMTTGTSRLPAKRVRKTIGDNLLTTLSASRVSSVVVIDDNCDCAGARQPAEEPDEGADASLSCVRAEVARAIARPYRVPAQTGNTAEDTYRLDRDFFDTDYYTLAVLPANRCVLMVADRCAQHGLESSALLEAGWTAYMVIGVATATGMIRSVFRDISGSDRSTPDSIADIEREAMVELHETYDLEIMSEAYRRRYRKLRKHLGITAEFKAISDKLEALYRETSTRFEGKSERRLQLLTWATAILSAVIAIGTLVLIFKGP